MGRELVWGISRDDVPFSGSSFPKFPLFWISCAWKLVPMDRVMKFTPGIESRARSADSAARLGFGTEVQGPRRCGWPSGSAVR